MSANTPDPGHAPGMPGTNPPRCAARRADGRPYMASDLACLTDYLARVVALTGFSLEADLRKTADGGEEAVLPAENYRDAMAALWTVQESLKSMADKIDALPDLPASAQSATRPLPENEAEVTG